MNKPVLRQYRQFSPSDFQAHPVWVCAYMTDQDEPWCDEVDEVTYRPWLGPTLFQFREDTMVYFAIKATFELADSTRLAGFATPPPANSRGVAELSCTQPTVFLPGGDRISFWTTAGLLTKEKERLYASLGKHPSEVFPIRYWFDAAIAPKLFVGVIEGFGALGGKP